MTDSTENTTIDSYEVILGVLTMVIIGKFTGMLPADLLEYALVAALPLHLLGLWLILKSGVEPLAYQIAEYLTEDGGF
jgi:hypothetical protein